MNNGYVSVPREFFDSIQWRRKRIFTESEAYLDLLQMAYYGSEPTERMVGRRSFIVKRGQIITTTSFLADRWGWKLHRVRYVLRALSVTSFVTSVVTSGRTIITVNQGNTSNCSEKSVTSFVTSIVNNKNKITKNILVLQNAFEKTRKQMKVNALSINALSDNLNFPMFAKLTLKKT